jgi:hypothetical protein
MTRSDAYFPFHRFNLKQNPFGTLNDIERLRVTVLPPPVEAALADGFEHLLVLGRKGRGKSTTLHYLVNVYRAQGLTTAYERLPRFHYRYTTDLAPLDVFALDEMQRIAPWEAVRLFQEARGKHLLIGSHADHTAAFRLRGLSVTTVRLGREANRDRLARILARRLDAFRLDESVPPGFHFTPDAVDWLWGRYGSDLRTMNSFLYDVCAALDTPGPIDAYVLDSILT